MLKLFEMKKLVDDHNDGGGGGGGDDGPVEEQECVGDGGDDGGGDVDYVGGWLRTWLKSKVLSRLRLSGCGITCMVPQETLEISTYEYFINIT